MKKRFDVLAAYRALLAQPDPPDLPHRGRRYLCAGDVLRQDALKRDLERAWVRHRMLDHGEEARIVSLRRLRLVRRRA